MRPILFLNKVEEDYLVSLSSLFQSSRVFDQRQSFFVEGIGIFEIFVGASAGSWSQINPEDYTIG